MFWICVNAVIEEMTNDDHSPKEVVSHLTTLAETQGSVEGRYAAHCSSVSGDPRWKALHNFLNRTREFDTDLQLDMIADYASRKSTEVLLAV